MRPRLGLLLLECLESLILHAHMSLRWFSIGANNSKPLRTGGPSVVLSTALPTSTTLPNEALFRSTSKGSSRLPSRRFLGHHNRQFLSGRCGVHRSRRGGIRQRLPRLRFVSKGIRRLATGPTDDYALVLVDSLGDEYLPPDLMFLLDVISEFAPSRILRHFLSKLVLHGLRNNTEKE